MSRDSSLLVVFSHGKESGPQGSKIQAMAAAARKHGAAVLSVDYRGMAGPDERVAHLLAQKLPPHETLVLVGSSMGGYVSTVASVTLRPDALFLLAPAFGVPSYPERMPVPLAGRSVVVHGWKDGVVSARNSIEWAERHGAELHLLDDGHRLRGRLEAVCRLLDLLLCDITRQG